MAAPGGVPPCYSQGSGSSQGRGAGPWLPTPSNSAARCQGILRGAAGAGGGAVSRTNCSRAAVMAAASSGEELEAVSFARGRRFTPRRIGGRLTPPAHAGF